MPFLHVIILNDLSVLNKMFLLYIKPIPGYRLIHLPGNAFPAHFPLQYPLYDPFDFTCINI